MANTVNSVTRTGGYVEKPFPAYRGEEPYVFVCYAHEDADVVYPELQRLHNSGINIWYDEGISPGHEWNQNVADSIEGSAQFLFFVSPSAVASRHCRNEAQYALDQEKALVSVYLEPTEVPGGLKLSLGSAQAIMKHEMSADAYQRKMSEALKILNEPREIVPEPAPAPSTNEAASASTLAIAVLPFVNMSNDPEQEFFSDGIAEDILNELARNTSLVVRPRSSAFALKGSTLDLPGIGQRLNVTHVLTGSVRRSGERIRVTVQLSEVDGNRAIWSDRYDRELTDIFVVQDEITREILTALNAQFVRRTAPRKFAGGEAYEAFLLGRHHLNSFKLDEATHWLKIATDLDPTNADAWGDLVRVSAAMTSNGLIPNSGETLRDRTEYIDRALNIDPTQPDVLGCKALDTFMVDRDSSIEQLAELVRVNPNHAEAHMYLSYALSGIGRNVLAERVALRATQLDPLTPLILANHVGALLYSGAVEEARQALDLYQVRIGELTAYYVFDVACAEGDVAAMQAALGYASWVGPTYPVYAALIPHFRGDQAAVQEILRPLKESTQYVSHLVQNRVALIEGRFDDALNHWREAIQADEPGAILYTGSLYPWQKTFPEFYAQTAYQQMLVEFGLDPESLSKIAVPELLF